MGFLLDTCVLIWLLRGENKLSAAAKKVFLDSQNPIYLSHFSAWEIALKNARHELDLRENAEQRIRRECQNRDIHLLSPEFEDYFSSTDLPLHHADPFDRLIVAQAIRRKLTIISPDKHLRKYAVKVLW